MDRDRYLALLNGDAMLLRATANKGLDAAVPTCPGWTVGDAVEHVTWVYEHKIACIRLAGEKPDPWPPPDVPEREPLEWFDDAYARLRDALTHTDPAAPSWTWWPADQTAGFWTRRMAQETAVHRADVESAYGPITPVAEDLAVDGVDEVLIMMLSGDWSDDPQPDLTGTVAVRAGGRTWRVAMTADQVTVAEDGAAGGAAGAGGGADVTVSGEPSNVLLWLWGRAPDDRVRFAGDAEAAQRFRRRLAIATE